MDREFDTSKDIYSESFSDMECWAQKNRIKNVILGGGDASALQCLMTREGGLAWWLSVGYSGYVTADLLTQTNGKMLKSFAYGVYAGLQWCKGDLHEYIVLT